MKNKIHAILAKENLKFKGTDIFGKRGRVWLEKVPLNKTRRRVVREYLALLDVISEKIERMDQLIAKRVEGDRIIEILESIPGIGITTAFLLKAEIGDINRFSSGKKLASYLGIVPRLYQSGGKHYTGRITKLGNPLVRWALVQSAHQMVRADAQMKCFYTSIAYRKGKKRAIVAVARKIAVLAWRLLVDNRVYKKYSPKRNL